MMMRQGVEEKNTHSTVRHSNHGNVAVKSNQMYFQSAINTADKIFLSVTWSPQGKFQTFVM